MEERNKPKLEDLESRIKALEEEIHKFKLDYLKGRIKDREEKRFSDKKFNDSIGYVCNKINSKNIVKAVVNLDNPEDVVNLDNPEDLESRIVALEKREKIRELRLDYLSLQYKIMKIKNQKELLESMEKKEEPKIVFDEDIGITYTSEKQLDTSTNV